MNTDTNTELIDLLALQDAIFTPVRSWTDRNAVTVIYEAREKFFRSGLPYKAGGTGAEREAGRAKAEQTEKSGTVRFFREGLKRVGWRLSDRGDWMLRAFALQREFPEMVAVLQAIEMHIDSGHSIGCMVREDALAGDYEIKNQSSRLNTVSDCLLPAMVRGLVDSHSDCQGHVWYTLTDKGRAFLKNPPAAPELPTFTNDEWIKVRGPYLAAADQYNQAVADHLDRLRGTKPQSTNHVIIPLPCGIDPEKPATYGRIVKFVKDEGETFCGLMAPRRLRKRKS